MSYLLIGAYIIFFAFVGGIACIVLFGLVSLAINVFADAYLKLDNLDKNEKK